MHLNGDYQIQNVYLRIYSRKSRFTAPFNRHGKTKFLTVYPTIYLPNFEYSYHLINAPLLSFLTVVLIQLLYKHKQSYHPGLGAMFVKASNLFCLFWVT